MKNFILSVLGLLVSVSGFSQEQKWHELRDAGANFYDIEEAFEQEWAEKEYQRGTGYNIFKRWKHFIEPRVYPHGDIHISGYYNEAFQKEKSKNKSLEKSSGDWQPLGYTEWQTDSYNPGNGRVNLVVKDPNVSGRYYVGTPSGGLWRTNDEFETWVPLTDDLPTLGVSGICIHPDDSDIIYLGTGDGDGGDTYSNGVLKSTDGGASWNSTGLSFLVTEEARINKLVMHPNNPDILFAATRNGLWKTTSAGEVWYQVEAGNIRDVEFKPSNPSVMYCCSNRIFVSEDGGEEFQTEGEGMPTPGDVERIALGVSPDEPDYVYALCVDDSTNGLLGLYRSEDSAYNFTLRADNPNVLGYSANGDSDGGQGFYDLALDIDPNDAERLYLGGINVWRSINGGQDFIINAHWFYENNMSLNYVHADIHNIEYIDGEIFVCSDGGVFRSTNNGGSFSDVSEGLQIAQFYRFGGYEGDPNILVGGTQDNGSIRLSGNTWTHELGADGMEAAIHPQNPNIMYVASQNGNIRKSLNGGASWSSATVMLDDDGGWVTPYVLHPNEEGTIFAGFTEVWKSENNGEAYEQLTDFGSGITLRDMAISASNPNVIVACTQGQVYRTENGGDTWETVASGLSPSVLNYVDINPVNEDHMVLAYSGFSVGNKVFETWNGGEDWENISWNLPNIPVNCVAIDADDNGLYIGTDLGVYYHTPELVGWLPFDSGLPNVIVTEIELNNSEELVTACTYGRGIWRSSQFSEIDELPVAAFNSDSQIICVGDSIQFFDESYGHEAGWNWTFEGADETLSTESSPVITYSTPGFYEVSLEVSNGLGSDVKVEQAYILVQSPEDAFPYQESFEGNDLLEFLNLHPFHSLEIITGR